MGTIESMTWCAFFIQLEELEQLTHDRLNTIDPEMWRNDTCVSHNQSKKNYSLS